jgi:hypothetical protein
MFQYYLDEFQIVTDLAVSRRIFTVAAVVRTRASPRETNSGGPGLSPGQST